MEIRFAYKLLLEPIPFQSSVGNMALRAHQYWLRVYQGENGVGMQHTNRLHHIWTSLPDPVNQRPSILFFLGKQLKTRVLRALYPGNTISNCRKYGIANICLYPATQNDEHPILIADSCPDYTQAKLRGKDTCHETINHPVGWPDEGDQKKQQHLADHALARLFSLFIDVLCIFAQDCGGLDGVVDMLAGWIAIGSASSLPDAVRPRFLVGSIRSQVLRVIPFVECSQRVGPRLNPLARAFQMAGRGPTARNTSDSIFMGLCSEHNIPASMIWDFIASVVIFDSFSPDMHMFNPSDVFRNLYRQSCVLGVHDFANSQQLDYGGQPAAPLRQRSLRRNFQHWSLLSHTSICLTCLQRNLEHQLECGHAICDDCQPLAANLSSKIPWHSWKSWKRRWTCHILCRSTLIMASGRVQVVLQPLGSLLSTGRQSNASLSFLILRGSSSHQSGCRPSGMKFSVTATTISDATLCLISNYNGNGPPGRDSSKLTPLIFYQD
ncbi:b676c3b9-d294-4f59-a3cf-c881fe8cd879-CDS [Sclerotinia trifoliorum]|uniref:B676c3b9-d294-4f59-a3cf-c881fe8cd879-CDS n=1 Tax=Sclerotinia trifoliorum TaxID=28548 RepID=A0A8H2VXZ6_9HELO|nr:b676c3b9-d294-4f59-a3cf-c881fe8cd879-CDS [Sclerotinia trifoliorum]